MRQILTPVEGYSDYSSLKAFLERKYGSNAIKTIRSVRNQTGTAAAVDLSEKASQTIAQITGTGITLIPSAADNAGIAGTVTMTATNTSGVTNTYTATLTVDMTSTPIAWTPAATNIVKVDSLIVSAAQPVDIVTKVSGGATYGTITAAATAATEAQLSGIGLIYGRSEADHADADSVKLYIEYATVWGEIKYGMCTFDTNAGSGTDTEVVFYETDSDYTATTVLVKDFYHVRQLSNSEAGTANSHSQWVCNSDGTAIYGVIEELLRESDTTAHYALSSNYRTFLARYNGNATTAAVTMTATFQAIDKPASATRSIQHGAGDNTVIIDFLLELEPLTMASFTILGDTGVYSGEFIILEAYVG